MRTRLSERFEYFASWLISVDPLPFMAILGAFTATWGGFLLLPWIDTFDSNALYDTMHIVADEWVWGLLMVTLGSAKIHFAFAPTIGRGDVVSAMAGAVLWAFIVAAMLVSARLTTAIPVYGWVLAWNCWLAYRVRGEFAANGIG